MFMLASTAVWLQKEVLDTLNEILNAEEPDLLVSTKERTGNHSALDNICRLFRDYVRHQSFCNCSSFINGSSESDKQA